MTKFISKTYPGVINAESKPSSRHAETLRTAVPASNKKGFTLIELLVVVLIIGILASVALPQYEVAVAKSRIAQLLPFMSSIRTAQEAYYMANGEYSNNWSELDISIPDNVSVAACGSGGIDTQCAVLQSGIKCPLLSSGGALYCKGDNIPNIGFAYENGTISQTMGKRVCFAYTDNATQNKICKSLGGVLKKIEYSQNRYEF